MHIDDDIFESLDIDEGLNNSSDNTENGGETGDFLSDEHVPTHADASDDIFESLDMEDKIYDTAFTPKPSSGDTSSRERTASASARANDADRKNKASGVQQTKAAVGQGKAKKAEDSFDEFDLSRRKPMSTGDEINDLIGDTGTAQGRTSARGSGRSSQRRAPKELNTADTSIDRKKYTKDKETKKKSKLKRIIICAVVELFTLCAIFVYGYLLKSWNLIARPDVRLEAVENNNISVEKKQEMEGYWNIAVFGVDTRGNSLVERGTNSDVIMIVSINKDTGEIKLVSVFRDTYLNISEKNSYNKINQAYAIGGPEQALAALNKNLDLNIQHYVAFNWKAVADGINILGGVDNIPISKAELYYINAYITETVNVTKIGSVQLTKTGEQHLDGVQAVAYGRLRYMDNDFARTERQRNIIKAAFAKAKKANFSVLNNIMVVCFPQVATNIEFGEVVDMAQHITQYNIGETGGFPWSRGDANIGKKGDCVIPTTLESNVVKLHEFLFGDQNYTPSNAVLNISETIKSDSGRYKEGKFIESVATDGGVIQKKKTPVETKLPAEEDEDESSSKGSNSKNNKETIGIDEDGNYIYPTNAEGNIIIPTDSSGKVIYPTDADGNIIKETSVARPTELSTEDIVPGEGDIDESDEPINEENGPMSTTSSSSHRQTTASGSGTSHSQNNETTGNNSSRPTEAQTTANSPMFEGPSGNPSGSTSSSNAPGGSSNSTVSDSPGGNSGSGAVISPDGPGSVTSGSSNGPGPG